MVSLKRYLNRTGEEVVLRQAVSLLLEKFASAAVVADERDFQAFRSDIEQLRAHADSDIAADGLLVDIGSATQALETYNRGITRFLHRQSAEMQSIVGMMTETVLKIGGEHTRSARRLQEIGDRMEGAGNVKDLVAMKSLLGDCLSSFRDETLRQKAEAENLIGDLRREIEATRERTGADTRDLDPATELPTRDACLRAMHGAVAGGKRSYVATMVVNRVQSINARFGHRAGDRVLHGFGEFVEQQLAPSDRLFRWTGPAVVALLERTEPLEDVRRQIRKMLEAHLDQTFEIEGRSVMIPVSAAWSVFPLITTVSTAERQINTFIASQHSHDFV